MVKPPLRTKSIGFKVSEEEYAQLETAAQASEQTRDRTLQRAHRTTSSKARSATRKRKTTILELAIIRGVLAVGSVVIGRRCPWRFRMRT